jgi:hypothetical protein
MGVILTGIVVAIALAIGAGFVLSDAQKPAWQAYSEQGSTRVGDPGENLVGQDWTGEPGGGAAHAEGEETPA